MHKSLIFASLATSVFSMSSGASASDAVSSRTRIMAKPRHLSQANSARNPLREKEAGDNKSFLDHVTHMNLVHLDGSPVKYIVAGGTMLLKSTNKAGVTKDITYTNIGDYWTGGECLPAGSDCRTTINNKEMKKVSLTTDVNYLFPKIEQTIYLNNDNDVVSKETMYSVRGDIYRYETLLYINKDFLNYSERAQRAIESDKQEHDEFDTYLAELKTYVLNKRSIARQQADNRVQLAQSEARRVESDRKTEEDDDRRRNSRRIAQRQENAAAEQSMLQAFGTLASRLAGARAGAGVPPTQTFVPQQASRPDSRSQGYTFDRPNGNSVDRSLSGIHPELDANECASTTARTDGFRITNSCQTKITATWCLAGKDCPGNAVGPTQSLSVELAPGEGYTIWGNSGMQLLVGACNRQSGYVKVVLLAGALSQCII